MSLKSIFELALTTDKRYNTGDISEKTGLQKQPDGSWAPPKGSSAGKHQKALENAKKVGIVKEVPAGWKKAEGVTTTPNGYVAITNGGSLFPKEGQQKREVKFIKQEDFEKRNGKSTLSPEKKQKWEADAKNSTIATLKNKIKAMEDAKGINPHAEEIINIYKKELKEKSPNSEKVYNDKSLEPIKKDVENFLKRTTDSACRLTGDTKIIVKK